jgi:hypothetical protein
MLARLIGDADVARAKAFENERCSIPRHLRAPATQSNDGGDGQWIISSRSLSSGAHSRDPLASKKKLGPGKVIGTTKAVIARLDRAIQGGFNWSSQHSSKGGCDEEISRPASRGPAREL